MRNWECLRQDILRHVGFLLLASEWILTSHSVNVSLLQYNKYSLSERQHYLFTPTQVGAVATELRGMRHRGFQLHKPPAATEAIFCPEPPTLQCWASVLWNVIFPLRRYSGVNSLTISFLSFQNAYRESKSFFPVSLTPTQILFHDLHLNWRNHKNFINILNAYGLINFSCVSFWP